MPGVPLSATVAARIEPAEQPWMWTEQLPVSSLIVSVQEVGVRFAE